MKDFKRILHATDFSPASRRAFSEALALAKENEAELVIVHVLNPASPMGPEGFVTPKMYDDMETVIRRSAGKRLDALLAKATKAGARARGLLLNGLPDAAVVQAAKSERSDLVLLGTHGRTGWKRLLMGSVASRVIASSPCPVLTVRA